MPASVSREYPNRPWVGVGVIVWRGDHVLLVKRGRPPRLGQWGLPGGAQELGETVYQTAIRELHEETGLDVVPYAVVTAVDSISFDATGAVQYHYTIIEVAAEVAAGCPHGDPVAADDAADACWVPLDTVASLVEWGETQRVIHLSAAQRGLPMPG